ncbi:4-hydroxy-tetrahydrodipicolinate reductase [Azospirillum doebereinerae]|uniref:4-hydroxy-tetrahydrodipicolinate reductase n=1 Tax=Azospirillum doebereinerae TaxID=92933 RepID=A0A433J1M9_9PROT|nr:4-hydroxy-tetrahydrodipicolinate reductase [Azospirillum doebereinerae]RUQ65023.1 4-hydroxy-tetrahydrodipicolinate reductase [Azospirillum doebereinerae]
MTISITLVGATGWVGKELVRAIAAAPDLTLAAAVARQNAGQDAGPAVGAEALGVTLVASLEEALATPSDVVIDYTAPTVVKGHTLAAIGAGRAVVVGTSGMTGEDYAEIDAAARAAGVGVVAAGNYSITAALMQRFALLAARHVPDVEVIDYASAKKPDVPSGTARELAERLSAIRQEPTSRPIGSLIGPQEARGATVGRTQVHAVRLPGFVLSCEVLFGAPDERLSIRHDAGSSAAPYVAGTLLAVRRVREQPGLRRGLDTLLD